MLFYLDTYHHLGAFFYAVTSHGCCRRQYLLLNTLCPCLLGAGHQLPIESRSFSIFLESAWGWHDLQLWGQTLTDVSQSYSIHPAMTGSGTGTLTNQSQWKMLPGASEKKEISFLFQGTPDILALPFPGQPGVRV